MTTDGERILLSQAHVTELEERYVLEALRSGWVAPLGPAVDLFEAEVAERCGVAGALALTTGTAALHLALLAVGAKPGTCVVLPSMTFAATINAVLYTGAEPVLVDCGDDANVDPDLLIEAVDTLAIEGRTIAAVMTVDLFGRCCDYDQIEPRLRERNIPLIEDAAEALGATHGGRAAGSFGTAAALSFNGNKIMTTSGGGMLLSNDIELLNWARYASTQARQPVAWYEHVDVGYNYRLSNILAALGRAQLRRLDDMIRIRRAHRAQYLEAFKDLPGMEMASQLEANTENCWLSWLTLDASEFALDPGPSGSITDSVIVQLATLGIEARHLWKPLHTQPAYKNARVFGGGVAERLFRNGLALPSGSALSRQDIERVINALMHALSGSTIAQAHA